MRNAQLLRTAQAAALLLLATVATFVVFANLEKLPSLIFLSSTEDNESFEHATRPVRVAFFVFCLFLVGALVFFTLLVNFLDSISSSRLDRRSIPNNGCKRSELPHDSE